jgi:hypothetical protein
LPITILLIDNYPVAPRATDFYQVRAQEWAHPHSYSASASKRRTSREERERHEKINNGLNARNRSNIWKHPEAS